MKKYITLELVWNIKDGGKSILASIEVIDKFNVQLIDLLANQTDFDDLTESHVFTETWYIDGALEHWMANERYNSDRIIEFEDDKSALLWFKLNY